MKIRYLLGLVIATACCAWADDSGNLEFLRTHPLASPKKVVLKEPVTLKLTMDGKVVGSLNKPAQAEVDVVRFREPQQLDIVSGNGQATIAPDQTDFWERVDAVRVKTLAPATEEPKPQEPAAQAAPLTPEATPAAPEVARPAGTPATFDVSIPPGAGFTKADFRLKLLDERPVKGVLVLVPGINGDGRDYVNTGRWQALAADLNLALVGCFMQGGYCDVEKGSGEALVDALKDFAKQSKHPELATVPLVMWGHSAGGQFNYSFVSWKPQRVAAFIVNKGGFYSGSPNGQSRKVPGIFFLGQKDTEVRVKNITEIYEKGRKLGALWALAPEPNSGHEEGGTPIVAEAFFRSVVPQRLTSSDKMAEIDESKGWLAASEKVVIEPAATSQLKKSEAGWLPDETTAKAWMAFMGK